MGRSPRRNQSSRVEARRSKVRLIVLRFRALRSSMPEICWLNSKTDSGRRSSLHSVTRHHDSVGSNRYTQVEKWNSIMEHSKVNARPGSASMTLPWVVHSCSPFRLWPSKVAPTTGPSNPSCHSQAWHSSDHSPMRVTSEMAAYASSDEAAMSREISILSVMVRSSLHVTERCRAGQTIHSRRDTGDQRALDWRPSNHIRQPKRWAPPTAPESAIKHTRPGAEQRARTTGAASRTSAQNGTSGALALCKQPALAGM